MGGDDELLIQSQRGKIVEQYLRMRNSLSQADVRVSVVMRVDWWCLERGLAVWRAVGRTTESVLLELVPNHSSQIFCCDQSCFDACGNRARGSVWLVHQ